MKKSSIIPLVSVFIISLYILSSCNKGYDSIANKGATSSIGSNAIISSASTGNTSNSGSITKTISYGTPSGAISTTFILDIDETNTIKTIKATAVSRDHEDIHYHNRFNNAAKSKIVGKKLSELSSITTIGGASLTTEAFKKTITSI